MDSPYDTAMPEALQIPVALSPHRVKENWLVQFAVGRAGSLQIPSPSLSPGTSGGDVCAPWQSFRLGYSSFQLQQKLLHE